MQIDPIIVTAISTSQNTQSNRVETVRREYVDNAGKLEIKETYYYYYLYNDQGKPVESSANSQVDVTV